jgi:hypothetical protein
MGKKWDEFWRPATDKEILGYALRRKPISPFFWVFQILCGVVIFLSIMVFSS